MINWVSGGDATVDPRIFDGKSFFKPIEAILKQNKRIFELDQKSFEDIMSQFGEFELHSNDRNLQFSGDNQYDLHYAYLDNSQKGIGRLLIHYRNCPVTSFYLLDDGKMVKIILSPFTKNYFTITESEWIKFIDYLENELGISEIRDIKINEILGDKNSHINVVRQLGFIVNNDSRQSNRFLSSVYYQYKEKGFITDRQASAVAKTIW